MKFDLSYLESDEKARSYLAHVRWGKWAICPHCLNLKAYFINNGSRYKCANPLCYKKFSVTSKSLLECSNLEYNVILKSIFIFCKNNGEVQIWDLEKFCSYSSRTARSMLARLKIAWPYVNDDAILEVKISDIISSLFNLYHKKNLVKESRFLDGIDDISDTVQFAKVLSYARHWLWRCYWIKTDQFEPLDIVAETFINLHDRGIKEYNADLIAKSIRSTTSKMWMQWVYAHPNTHERYLAYYREYQRKERRSLGINYILSKIKREKKFKELPMSELRATKDLIASKRERINKFREKFGVSLIDFKSHFD